MKNRISIPDTDLAFHPLGLGTVNAGLTWDGADADRIFDAFLDMGGSILGKPHDKAHAAEMLRMLSGKTHAVHTGVCMVWQKGEIRFCETTLVTFRRLDEQDISPVVRRRSFLMTVLLHPLIISMVRMVKDILQSQEGDTILFSAQKRGKYIQLCSAIL